MKRNGLLWNVRNFGLLKMRYLRKHRKFSVGEMMLLISIMNGKATNIYFLR